MHVQANLQLPPNGWKQAKSHLASDRQPSQPCSDAPSTDWGCAKRFALLRCMISNSHNGNKSHNRKYRMHRLDAALAPAGVARVAAATCVAAVGLVVAAVTPRRGSSGASNRG